MVPLRRALPSTAPGCYPPAVRAPILVLSLLLTLPAVASAQATPTRAQVRQMLSGIEDVPSARDWQRLGPDVLPVLMALYQDADEPNYVRLRAVGATAAFDRPAVRTFLLAVATVEGQRDLFVREAVLGLGRAFGAAAVRDVAPFLDHAEPIVREGAAAVLVRNGAEDLVRARLRIESDPAVRRAFESALDR